MLLPVLLMLLLLLPLLLELNRSPLRQPHQGLADFG